MCLPLHVEQLGSQWMKCHEIKYLSICQKSVEKSQVWLKIWQEWWVICLLMSHWILRRMRTVSEKKQWRKSGTTNFFLPQKSCRLWDNVEKYGGAGQALGDNILWRRKDARMDGCTCTHIHTHTHTFIHSFHRHVQNVTIPCRSQELLPFLSVIYFFLPPFSTNYSSILSDLILPSISWSTSQSFFSQIHIQYSFGNPAFYHSLYMPKPT
jgi:hypothetical protein